MSNFSQECTIKMGVESEANETVQLLAEKVFSIKIQLTFCFSKTNFVTL